MRLNKVIVAPDSFKGALAAQRVADIIAEEIGAAFPGCQVVKMPVADGGEGSIDTLIGVMGGEIFREQVTSPDGGEIEACYGVTANGTAVIEMAQSSGLTRQNGLHPMTSNTYGFGQLISSALRRGVEDFILCIGGSATTDGGCGMASALGARFLDSAGNSFIPCGGTLCDIHMIDLWGIDKRVSESSFIVMCDVENPLFGINGAAYVYAPQKGATPEQVVKLDEGLLHFGVLLYELLGRDFANVPGAGAAGGLGAGCMAFLGAVLLRGSEAIMDMCGLKKHIAGTDLIITGEGKLDAQSFSGKALSGVLRGAGGVPVWSICGVNDCDEALASAHGVSVFEACEGVSAVECMADAEGFLRLAARKALLGLRDV